MITINPASSQLRFGLLPAVGSKLSVLYACAMEPLISWQATPPIQPLSSLTLGNVATCTMTIVQTFSGEVLTLPKDIDKAVEFLRRDGCLILKGVADVRRYEAAFERRFALIGEEKVRERNREIGVGPGDGSLACINRDGVLNKDVGLILFTEYHGDLTLSAYVPVVLFSYIKPREKKGHEAGIFECIHLGGEVGTAYSINVETEDGIKPLSALAGDTIICLHNRRRTTPKIIRGQTTPSRAFFIRSFLLGTVKEVGGRLPAEILKIYREIGNTSVIESRDGQYAIWSRREFLRENS